MKKSILLTMTIMWTLLVVGQTQKTFVKSFTNTASSVTVSVNGPVEVEEWNEPYVRVLTNVDMDNTTKNVLMAVATSGRYKLSIKTTENGTLIYSNEEFDPIKFKGQILNEDITYKVFVPLHTDVKIIKTKQEL